MTKVIKNSSVTITTEKDSKALASLTEDLVFIPNPRHRQVKSKFWARYDSMNIEPSALSAAAVMDVTGEPAIGRWWSLPGFKAWFLNQDEARERLEYLYMLALDSAEAVLLDPDANGNAKVQMVKIIAQLAGKEPNSKERYADEEIGRMDAEKLKAYIEKTAPRLLSSNPTDKDKKDD